MIERAQDVWTLTEAEEASLWKRRMWDYALAREFAIAKVMKHGLQGWDIKAETDIPESWINGRCNVWKESWLTYKETIFVISSINESIGTDAEYFHQLPEELKDHEKIVEILRWYLLDGNFGSQFTLAGIAYFLRNSTSNDARDAIFGCYARRNISELARAQLAQVLVEAIQPRDIDLLKRALLVPGIGQKLLLYDSLLKIEKSESYATFIQLLEFPELVHTTILYLRRARNPKAIAKIKKYTGAKYDMETRKEAEKAIVTLAKVRDQKKQRRITTGSKRTP